MTRLLTAVALLVVGPAVYMLAQYLWDELQWRLLERTAQRLERFEPVMVWSRNG